MTKNRKKSRLDRKVRRRREAGTQVLDIFSEWKAIYVDYSGKLQKAQIDEIDI